MKSENEELWKILLWFAFGTFVIYAMAFRTPEEPRKRTGTAVDYHRLLQEQNRQKIEKIRKELREENDRYWGDREYTNYHIF